MLLDTLPPELLPNIFDHVPADGLWTELRAVNRGLNRALKQPAYWLNRANRFCGLALPHRLKSHNNNNAEQHQAPVNIGGIPSTSNKNDGEETPGQPEEEEEPSQLMPICRCVATERAAHRWAQPGNGLSQMEAHLGTIDALRLFRDSQQRLFCLSGARDREIKLWPMDGWVEEKPLLDPWLCHTVEKAHDGWIWSLSPVKGGSHFYSAGWDSTVKKWQLAEAAILPLLTVPTGAAALCCVAEADHLLYVSTYQAGPILYDFRVGQQPQAVQHCHGQKSVIELATDTDCNAIFSISDGCQLFSVDKRQFQRPQPLHSYQTSKTISHIDYSEGQLGVCTRYGQLLLLDPDTLQLEKQMEVAPDLHGHQYLRVTRGANFFASSDQQLRIFTPGVRPRLIASTRIEGNFTHLDVLGKYAVAAQNLGSLTIWQAAGG